MGLFGHSEPDPTPTPTPTPGPSSYTAGGPTTLDPVSQLLLSSFGWEMPLTEEHQVVLISLLSMFVLVNAVVILLLVVVGVGTACEDLLALFRGECCLCWARFRNSGKGTFVLIEEDTDVEAAALAAAQMLDMTPRSQPADDARAYNLGALQANEAKMNGGAAAGTPAIAKPQSSRPGKPPALVTGGVQYEHDDQTSPPKAPRGPRGLAPNQRLQLADAANSEQKQLGAAHTSRGMASERRSSPQLSQRAATARCGTARCSARTGTERADAQVPFWERVGWKDKDNPGWYGV